MPRSKDSLMNKKSVRNMRKQLTKQNPTATAEQIRTLVYERIQKNTRYCKVDNFEDIREQCIRIAKPIVEFFVGDYSRFKKRYYQRRKNLIVADPTSIYLRPWYYEAFARAAGGQQLLADEQLRDVAVFTQSIAHPCKKHGGKLEKYNVPLGVVMKLALGTFNKSTWSEYCAAEEGKKTGYDYSHINSISADINPFNATIELRRINLGRKPCHGSMLRTDADYCKRHSKHPCFLAGMRMQLNHNEIARKMIELAQLRRPAIEAYEQGILFTWVPG